MEGPSSQASTSSEAVFDSINKISQAINAKDQKLIENEALIIYTKLEINKLQTATKELNDQCRNLQSQTELFQQETRELEISLDTNRKSVEVKSDMCITLKQQIDRLEAEMKELINHCETVYNEYLGKYKKARSVYETHHPLFSQVKQLQIENLRLEVQYKILRAKVLERKKQIKQSREIHRQIFSATIVNFAKTTLEHWKARYLAHQLEEAEKEEMKLVEQLRHVNMLAAKMAKGCPVSNETSKLKNSQFLADQNWTELNNSNNHPFVAPAPVAPSTSLGSFNLLENSVQSEETFLKIRARLNQRQQRWGQQRSFSSPGSARKATSRSPNIANNNPRNLKQTPVFDQTPISGQKRPLMPSNLSYQSPQFKIPKTAAIYNVAGNENSPFMKPQMIQKPVSVPAGNENPTFIDQNSKVKIISVHTLTGNDNSTTINQQSFQKTSSQESNKNFNQVISQQTPQYLPRTPQSCRSQNVISSQSQEIDKNVLTPSMNMATPKQQPQGYRPETFFSQEVNRNTPTPLGSINKVASQEKPRFVPQTPLEYHTENPPSQLRVVPETMTQENSQILKDASAEPYATCQFQSDATQNLTQMFSSGNQPSQTQATDKSADNTIGTSQSSTYSQKYMEMQHILEREMPDMVYMPPSAPQIEAIKPVEAVTTSPFFNKPKTGETTGPINEPSSNPAAQELVSSNEDIFTNPENISQYLDNSGLLYKLEGETDISFDYQQVLSPDYEENDTSASELQAQPAGFNFNFGQPQTAQPGEMRFTFSDNTTTSNPFNMF